MSAVVSLPVSRLPSIDVLVPVYNEAGMIEDKLANLDALEYPRDRFRVLVIDGGSDDGTPDLARRWAERHGRRVEVVSTGAIGKPAQLNAGLERCRGDWILVTDADARLSPGTLATMVDRARADSRVSVVGAEIRPAQGHPLDHAHWAAANWLLRLESRLGTAGLVVGPCYMVRHDRFDPLPPDTVADDVRVSCRALLNGGRIACAPVHVIELRTPVRGRELFTHKVRKARGYMHEVRASLSLVRGADPLARTIFGARALMLVAPPLLLVGCMLAVAVLAGWGAAAAAALLAGGLGLAFLKSRPGRSGPPGLLTSWVGLPLVASAVLLAAICTRPFTSVSARYPRIQWADPAREV